MNGALMKSKRDYALSVVLSIVKDTPTAEMVIERLQDEGLLHLGYGDADVDRVLEVFQRNFGNTKTTKWDRFAANRMSAKYGSQSIVKIIELLATAQGDKYAPTASSVAKLEEKLPAVLSYLRKQQATHEEIEL